MESPVRGNALAWVRTGASFGFRLDGSIGTPIPLVWGSGVRQPPRGVGENPTAPTLGADPNPAWVEEKTQEGPGVASACVTRGGSGEGWATEKGAKG